MQFYTWILWFHVISMVAWFAVLFYMPRLFVYHAENAEKADFVNVVKIMEKKIYYYIGVPSMWATIISGTTMIILNPALFQSGGWLHTKLLFVAFLIGYFFSMGHFYKQLLADSCEKSGKFFRMYNEIPTLLIMVIVAMVIVKPF